MAQIQTENLLIIGLAVLFSCSIIPSLGTAAAAPDLHGQTHVLADQSEPNDNQTEATPIGLNGTGMVEVSGSFDSDGSHEDWYSFEVTAGQLIRIRVPYLVNAHTSLIAKNGTVLVDLAGSSGTMDGEAIGAKGTTTGTYYVRVTSRQRTTTVNYTLSVALGESDQWEPNDAIESATSIKINTQLEGTITQDNSEDLYAITLDAGNRLNATLDPTGGGATIQNQVALDILASNGTEIGKIPESPYDLPSSSTGPAGTGSYYGPVTQRVTADRTDSYYVRVTGKGVAGFFSYSLRLRSQNTPPSHRNTIRIQGRGPLQNYTFSAANITAGSNANIDDGTDVIAGDTVHGTIGAGGTDTYHVSGSISEFAADDPDRITAEVDGETVNVTTHHTSKMIATTRISSPAPTSTPTVTPTPSPTSTSTPTETLTHLPTSTPVATQIQTSTLTATRTSTPMPVSTPSPTSVVTATPTSTSTSARTSAAVTSTSSTPTTPATESPTSPRRKPALTTATTITTVLKTTNTHLMSPASPREIPTSTTSLGTTDGTGPGTGLAGALVAIFASGLLIARSRSR